MDQDPQRPSHRSPHWMPAALGLAAVSVLAACGGPSATTPGPSGRVASLLDQGLAAQRAGRNALADADYLNVLKLDHANVYAWYNLGLIAEDRGDVNGAAYDYRQAVAVDPRYVPALYNLATAQAATNPSAAIIAYQEVVKLDPKDAAARFNLGLALEATGQDVRGRAEIARAVALDPGLAHGSTTSTTTRP